MNFGDGERAYLHEMRMISTDNAGNEVFVGLTVAESAEYYTFTRLNQRPDRGDEGRDRYLELHEKHERTRLAILAAEVSARHDTSPRH